MLLRRKGRCLEVEEWWKGEPDVEGIDIGTLSCLYFPLVSIRYTLYIEHDIRRDSKCST